jgi:hypothetical protein
VKQLILKQPIMKKFLFGMIALWLGTVVMAQKPVVKRAVKHYFALLGGPSFPVGEFAQNSLNTSNIMIADRGAGFAKAGVNVNFTYGYHISSPLGITASVFYNNHALNNAAMQRELERELDIPTGSMTDLKPDHWQWYGIAAGPMFFHQLSPNVTLNLRAMAGIANANSPKFAYQGVTLFKEDWSVAALFNGGMDFQFKAGNNLYVFTGADYLYMQPKFTVEAYILDQSFKETGKQKMAVINVHAGLGFGF